MYNVPIEFDHYGLDHTAAKTFSKSWKRCIVLWLVSHLLCLLLIDFDGDTPFTEFISVMLFMCLGAYLMFWYMRRANLKGWSTLTSYDDVIPNFWSNFWLWSPAMLFLFIYDGFSLGVVLEESGAKSYGFPLFICVAFLGAISYVGHRRTWVARKQEQVEDTLEKFYQEQSALVSELQQIQNGSKHLGIFRVRAVGSAGDVQANLDLQPIESNLSRTPVAVYGGGAVRAGDIISVEPGRHISNIFNAELLEWGAEAQQREDELIATLKVPRFFLLIDRLFGEGKERTARPPEEELETELPDEEPPANNPFSG